jgi:hypothetical protein
MLIDHLGFTFFPDFLIFRIIGRLALPLFAWGVAIGYTRTRDVKKYGQRLLVLAIISQPIFYLAISESYLNICFTLFLGLLAIYFYDRIFKNYLNLLFLILSIASAYVLNVEYGVYGVLMILLFFIFRKNFLMIPGQSILVFIFALLNPNSIFQIFSIPAFFIIYYFQKYDFRINRLLQYSFYPAHLLVLYLLSLLFWP